MKEALPTIARSISGIRNLALLDMGCLQLLISRPLCHSWKRKEVDLVTVGERTLRCSGVGLVQFDMSNRPPINVEVLVVDDKLLGFDLLLRFVIIKKLGRVCVTSDQTMSFPQFDRPLFTAIIINKPDFMWNMTTTGKSGLFGNGPITRCHLCCKTRQMNIWYHSLLGSSILASYQPGWIMAGYFHILRKNLGPPRA